MINFQIENVNNKVEILLPSGSIENVRNYSGQNNIKLKLIVKSSYDLDEFKSINYNSLINYHMCVILNPVLFEGFKKEFKNDENFLIKNIRWSESYINVDFFILEEFNQYIMENNSRILTQFNMDEPDINLAPKSLYVLNEALASLRKLDTISASYNNRDEKISSHLQEIEALINNTRK